MVEQALETRLALLEQKLDTLIAVHAKTSDRLEALEQERTEFLKWGVIAIGAGFVSLIVFVAMKLGALR